MNLRILLKKTYCGAVLILIMCGSGELVRRADISPPPFLLGPPNPATPKLREKRVNDYH